jgi:hypothetical protein
MSPERESEFDALVAYISFFATNILRIGPDDDIHPVRTIERMVSTYGKSKALAGLRQAVNDSVEETSNWSAEARTILDAMLRNAGIMTLSEIARRYAARYKRILKRGSIKNETEYYLVNGILTDQGSGIPDEERRRIQDLVDGYERMVNRTC